MVAKSTDALVAVSPDVRDEGLRRRIGSAELYEVIPEFVDYRPSNRDFSAGRCESRRLLDLDADDEVIGWVGRFVPQKDPETLARALELILTTRSNTRAVLVGDGPLRKQTQQRLSAHSFGDRILFAGLRPDARSLYAAFDVLVHPSLWEGQPRVIQEAIAERIPVIATRVEGTSDLVSDGRTGYLTPPGDAEGIAARALEVFEGKAPRAPLPKNVVAEVAERHGHDRVLRAHIELYERLLTKRVPDDRG
jgi:glycosyltransferase involved in cell wall biosynthesis